MKFIIIHREGLCFLFCGESSRHRTARDPIKVINIITPIVCIQIIGRISYIQRKMVCVLFFYYWPVVGGVYFHSIYYTDKFLCFPLYFFFLRPRRETTSFRTIEFLSCYQYQMDGIFFFENWFQSTSSSHYGKTNSFNINGGGVSFSQA